MPWFCLEIQYTICKSQCWTNTEYWFSSKYGHIFYIIIINNLFIIIIIKNRFFVHLFVHFRSKWESMYLDFERTILSARFNHDPHTHITMQYTHNSTNLIDIYMEQTIRIHSISKERAVAFGRLFKTLIQISLDLSLPFVFLFCCCLFFFFSLIKWLFTRDQVHYLRNSINWRLCLKSQTQKRPMHG